MVTVFISGAAAHSVPAVQGLLPLALEPWAVSRTRFILVLLTARRSPLFRTGLPGRTTRRELRGAWIKGHLWHMGGLAAILFVALHVLIRWSERGRVRLDPADEMPASLPAEPKTSSANGSGYNK